MNLVERTEQLFNKVRINISEAMASLYEVFESKAWEEKYSSFGEFVEGGCGISQSQASKLLKVHKHFVIEGGMQKESLTDVDAEKLYLAVALQVPTEQKVAMARTLTRSELKEEVANKDTEHVHEPIFICKHCHKRLYEHSDAVLKEEAEIEA